MISQLFTVIGAAFVIYKVVSLVRVLYAATLGATNKVEHYKKGDSPYTIITGASEGIGRQFAFQLAKKGLNIMILARTKSKLDTLKDEIQSHSKVNVIVYPFDFSTTEQAAWDALAKEIEKINVTTLVNNVAMNHAFPVAFDQENEELISNIVQCNISAQLKLISLVMPKMRSSKNGLILNMGSLAGIVPSSYLSVYSASKSFLRTFSIALAKEVESDGITVQHINAFFVVSNMSKIRRPSFTTPTPEAFVKSVLKRIGTGADITPYPSHDLLNYLLGFMSESFLVQRATEMHLAIRKRALRKLEREGKKEE